MTLQYSNPLRILFTTVFSCSSKIEAIAVFFFHFCLVRNQLILSFLRNASHIPPETSKEEMDSLFLAPVSKISQSNKGLLAERNKKL